MDLTKFTRPDMWVLAEHVAKREVILLVSVELDTLNSYILRVFLLTRVRSLAIIGELADSDVNVLEV